MSVSLINSMPSLILRLIFSIPLGLIFGSFVTAFSWRIQKGISIAHGRSICPKCKHQINWYDNIPVLSYIALRGKCRHCHKKISIRYPIIELVTVLTFCLVAFKLPAVLINLHLTNLPLSVSIFFLIFLIVIFLTILVIDLEKQIIPDELVFITLLVVVSIYLVADVNLFPLLLTGYIASLSLLLINLITLGRGMGLGDVKLAILLGLLLGPINTVSAIFLAFLTGSVVGIILILVKRAKFGQKIAFGPFLILGFFLALLFNQITKWIIPF
ncbi:prepilin peptidase [Candidatus Microgenomates bacterium]|nr:prepilin peptidase [Candidatus Microgenomates bacterium]